MKESISENTPTKDVKYIIKGVGISFVITMVMLLIYAILLTYTQISEDTIPTIVVIITSISILIGSSIANSKIRKKGIINGAVIGIIYITIIYIISSIVNNNFSLNIASIIMIILSSVFGIIGGIIGVNRK